MEQVSSDVDTKKLEHIIIIILALLNVFLLALVASDAAGDRNSRRETEELLTGLLEENGIAVGPGAELIQTAPAGRTIERDMEQEAQRMQGLLGEHVSEDLGGSIWFYHSDSGQVVMRGTGEMDYLTESGVRTRSGSPEAAAKEMFRRAGVELYAEDAAPDAENDLTLCCVWGGFPVYNAALTFRFSGDALSIVSGTLVFSRETAVSESAVMDSAGVLVRFVELVRSEGLICSELRSLTPGYYMTVTVSGESVLTPVWRLATDTGDVYVNAVNGRLETV